jgi:2-methylcitrate dehydratase PrpD
VVNIGDKIIDITICDVANICVFVAAKDMGISGDQTADQINSDCALISRCKELRGKASQLLGLCTDWEKVDEQSPGLPMVVLVSPSPEGNNEGHVVSRLLLNNSCHDTMAGTGAICTAACGWVKGSVVNRQLKGGVMPEELFKISHPLGQIPVMVKRTSDRGDGITATNITNPDFSVLAILRTSRRIMDGYVYVPNDIWDGSLPPREDLPNNFDQLKDEHMRGSKQSDVQVTKRLAIFVADLKFQNLPDTHILRLKSFLLDYIGVTAYGAMMAESSSHFVEAIKSLGCAATSKSSTVIGKGMSPPSQYTALLNGAFAHSLDYDDTYAPGIIHPGVSAISAALCMSDTTSNLDLLTAIAAGYEVACRVGRALGSESYEQGFHITGTAGIFGAVSAICKLKHLNSRTIEMAYGLAGSKAAGSMQFLATGAWNKRLHPGFAAHDAVLCVALAEAGVHAAEQAIEGEFGLLQAYTPAEKTPEKVYKLVDGLGSVWESGGTAIKPYPACRMTHSAIAVADSLRKRAGGRTVKRIEVFLAPHCVLVVGQNVANKVHATNVVEGQFSLYFQVAVAWLHGSGLGWRTYNHLADQDLNELTKRITVVGDVNYKALETKISVMFDDGTELTGELLEAPGEPPQLLTWEMLQEKFESLTVPVYGTETSHQISEVVKAIDTPGNIERLMELVR